MPRHCSAAGCNSRDTRDARKAGLTFHRLPKRGNPRRATWILNSLRKGPEGKGLWDPQSDYIYFCSKHFTPDSFELSGVSGYRRLKDDAVPTVVETPSFQRGKVSRGRGRPRNVGRQRRWVKITTDTEKSESKEVPVSEAFVQSVADEDEAERSETTIGEQGAEQTPTPLSDDVQSNKISPHDQPADSSPSPTSLRPPSPSCYMRRLPPPPGFYLAKEHSYAQLCPLVWRKRYEKAIDNLEKALRLLSAARRRENRLRLTLLRLRENRLKSTLSRIQDSGRRKEGHGGHGGHGKLRFTSPQSGKTTRADRGGTPEGLEESEVEGATEDMEIFTEEGWRRPASTAKERVTVEEEEGCCFYCGRGREDEESKEVRERQTSRRATENQGSLCSSKPKRIQEGKTGREKTPDMFPGQRAASVRNEPPAAEPKECYFYYCENDASEDQTKTVSVDLSPQQQHIDGEPSLELYGKSLQQVALLHPQTEMLLQMHAVSGPTQPVVTLQEAASPLQLQQLHLLQPSLGLQPGLLLSDVTAREGNAAPSEPDVGNRVYWIQERSDSHVLLIPVSAETKEASGLSADTALKSLETQSILVTEEGFQQVSEDADGLSVEGDLMGLRNTGLRDSQNCHQSNLKATVVSGDVRQRLKEHLEGFQLQLSSEFID